MAPLYVGERGPPVVVAELSRPRAGAGADDARRSRGAAAPSRDRAETDTQLSPSRGWSGHDGAVDRGRMSVLLLLACAAPGPLEARAAWLQEELTLDNARWLARGPDLVETKYTRMAADPYDWLRGTTALFLADQLRPDPDRVPTAFLTEPDAAAVLLVGDPHLENLGLLLPGEEPDAGLVPVETPLPLEWVDLDAATFGPWTADTRRAALALALVAEEAEAGSGLDDLVGGTVAAFAAAYADEITRRARGEPGWDAGAEDDAILLAGLREDAREEGAAGAELDEYTAVVPDERGLGVRRLALDVALGAEGEGLLAPSPRAEDQLRRLLGTWSAGRPDDLRVLEVARLYGKGVASLPAQRYLVLWDRGDDGLADDRLAAFREVVDPPSVDGVVAGLGSVYADNADRIVRVSTTFWSRADADARLDGVRDGAEAFKSYTVTGWNRTFDHADVARLVALGGAGPADLEALGALVGRALASAHARGTTLDGAPSLPVLAADLAAGGGPEVFVAERGADAIADLAALHVDHGLFLALLQRDGPLLGAEALYP